MLEALFSIVAAIIEAVTALIGALIEAIAALFTVGGEALTASEAIATLFSFVVEIIFWSILWAIEIVVALSTRRRPKKIARPTIWRPKNKGEPSEDENT